MIDTINACIICISSNAHSFINDWCEYHLNLGFKHIFIIDNNFEYNKYIIDDINVTVIPYYDKQVFKVQQSRGFEEWVQIEIYKKMIEQIYNEQLYNYVLIIDDDEFLDFNGNYKNINEFISDYRYLSSISFEWNTVTDSGYYYCEDLPLNKKIYEIYTEPYAGGNIWNIKSLYKIDIDKNTLNSILNTKDDWFMHNSFMFGKRHVIDKNIAKLNHIRTQCIENYIKIKTQYNTNELDPNIVTRRNFAMYYYLSNYTSEKSKTAFIDLANKYNLILTQKDKEILCI